MSDFGGNSPSARLTPQNLCVVRNILCAMKNTRIFLIILLATVAGCAGVSDGQRDQPSSAQDTQFSVAACNENFAALDAAIDTAGARDGGDARMEGFPYLRVNRFLASFAAGFQTQDAANTTQFNAWAAKLRTLDLNARDAEISNLPIEVSAKLGASKSIISANIAACADLMLAADMLNATRRSAMVQAARVPNDYSTFNRLLGLYPLTKMPFFRGVEGWQRKAALTIQSAPSTKSQNYAITRYSPASRSPPANILSIFKNAPRDSLGIPTLSAADWAQLFDAHAPVFEVETAADDDRIGAVQWRRGAAVGDAPLVDISRPSVYRRLSSTRIAGKTYSQLVFSVWFRSRPRAHAFDLLAGALDSVMWRVTLDADGAPLIYDSIHACGCYHMFFPSSRMQPRPAPVANMEWAFVPKSMPTIEATQRITLRLAAESHYIVGVSPSSAPSRNSSTENSGIIYDWRDDDELRKLDTGGDHSRSIFQPSGIVAGTERGERFFFWPMGITSAGAMRQWGRHATAFVGIRHFDDADLLDLRFSIVSRELAKSTMVNKR